MDLDSVTKAINIVKEQLQNDNDTGRDRDKQLEDILIKQGKQICALYELLKLMNTKVTWIENHLKKQNDNKNVDLSQKVFAVS